MKITCTVCNGKAVITHRNEIDSKVSELYCSCRDSECGHSFVMTLSFKHSLSPSSKSADDMMVAYFKQLPKEKQMDLLKSMDK